MQERASEDDRRRRAGAALWCLTQKGQRGSRGKWSSEETGRTTAYKRVFQGDVTEDEEQKKGDHRMSESPRTLEIISSNFHVPLTSLSQTDHLLDYVTFV